MRKLIRDMSLTLMKNVSSNNLIAPYFYIYFNQLFFNCTNYIYNNECVSLSTANQKEVRRVTVLHRSLTELHDSEGTYNIYCI